MVGRPEEITINDGADFNTEILQKLEEAFKKGMSNREACFLADISESIFYKVLEVNEKLKERFPLLQNSVKIRAKENIVEKINAKDVELSKWYLERRDKEFKPKSDLTSDDEPLKPILVEFINEKDNKNTNGIQEVI